MGLGGACKEEREEEDAEESGGAGNVSGGDSGHLLASVLLRSYIINTHSVRCSKYFFALDIFSFGSVPK